MKHPGKSRNIKYQNDYKKKVYIVKQSKNHEREMSKSINQSINKNNWYQFRIRKKRKKNKTKQNKKNNATDCNE